MENQSSSTRSQLPLIVDLDGTLLRSDLLIESTVSLLKQNFFYLFLLPIWLTGGKAKLKHEIASRVDIDVTNLPFNQPFLTYLRQEQQTGRQLILATASHTKFAHQIAEHVGLFQNVIATETGTNLKGTEKLKAIQTKHPEFAYAGNEAADIPIWREAKNSLIITDNARLVERVKKIVPHIEAFTSGDHRPIRSLLKAMRLHQWVKNVLIFIPAIVAHAIFEPSVLVSCIIAFIAYGLCASSLYLLNDIVDLAEDRSHPIKRNRPFASGDLNLAQGIVAIPALLTLSLGLSWFLPAGFLAVLGLYTLTTLTYSFLLKRAVLVDVLTLAGLYTLRLFAGGVAVGVELSFWLLAFSMFVFFSLALIKRFAELKSLASRGELEAQGRGYRVEDLDSLSQFGISSAYLSVLVLALYINTDNVQAIYSQPEAIWLLCPMLLYLITRMWLLARREELDDDPIRFVLKDYRSLLALMLGGVLLFIAS